MQTVYLKVIDCNCFTHTRAYLEVDPEELVGEIKDGDLLRGLGGILAKLNHFR